jgi:DHA2 family multidrug resistance protein-like MFS transporter
MSETASELGGALGISVLGSIGVAIYRADVARSLPGDIPATAADAARDTLGAAVGVAGRLSGDLSNAVVAVAQGAFVEGMQVAATISAALAVGVAMLSLLTLRDVRMGGDDDGSKTPTEGAAEPDRPGPRPTTSPVPEA